MVRFDYIFSYWIFVWYILYYFNFIPYSPKLALILALIENIGLLIGMLYYSSLNMIFLFCFINFFIKIIPLWTLRKEKIYKKDIYPLITIFIIYNIWLIINNTNLYKIMKKAHYDMVHNLPIGPLSYILKNIKLNR